MSVRSIRRGITYVQPMSRGRRAVHAVMRGVLAACAMLVAWVILLYALGAERLNGTALLIGAVFVALVFVVQTVLVYRNSAVRSLRHVSKRKGW